MSDSLPPHGLQHARLPRLSPSPRACSNPCPFRRMMPSNQLILYHPFLLLPSIFPSMRVFSNESALHIRWPKYWNFRFSFSISLSNEYLELISFKIHWFYFLAVQGTLSRDFSNTTVQKHQFVGAQPSLCSTSHIQL